jgi:hypothetical protein
MKKFLAGLVAVAALAVPSAASAHTNALPVQEYLNRSVGLADQYLCGHNNPGWQCFAMQQAWVVNWQAHGPHVAVSYLEATASGGRRSCTSNIYWSHEVPFNYGNSCWLPF